jgi:hypothetical protein
MLLSMYWISCNEINESRRIAIERIIIRRLSRCALRSLELLPVTVFFTSLSYSTTLTLSIGLTVFLPEERNCTSMCWRL